MSKDYLEKKLEDKGKKQIEQKIKIDKEVVQLKYKGNQKQFELHTELDTIIENIATESNRSEPNLTLIKKHTQEARQLIRKRQKLIKIADKGRDGWQVVAEYESDELASGSEDEKHLKKAREAASGKRRQKDQLAGDRGKKPRVSMGADNQLFRGNAPINVKPQGRGVGHVVGILTFSFKIIQIPHPWDKITGQMSTRRQVKEVKCPS